MVELSGRPLRNTRRDRELFVDRTELIAKVHRAALNGGNVLLVGSRGIGKTSLLRMLAHVMEDEEASRPAIVDGRAADSIHEFLTLVRDALEAWRTLPLRQVLARTVGADPFSNFANLSISDRPSPSDTQTLLGQLRSIGGALEDGQRRVLLVDEMPSPESAHTLFGRLRDELWELPIVWVVVADERDVGMYRKPPADAFWQRVETIPPFDEEALTEILFRRVDGNQVAAETVDQLVHAAEGNPRQLMTLAHQVVLDGADVGGILERRATVQEGVANLSAPAKSLLAELRANGGASASDQSLLTKFGWSRSRASQLFRELEREHLVTVSEQSGSAGRPRRVYEAVT